MPNENKQNEFIEATTNFYEGLSDEDIEEIERIALDRSNFFSRDPNRVHELVDGITEENLQEAIDSIEDARTNNL